MRKPYKTSVIKLSSQTPFILDWITETEECLFSCTSYVKWFDNDIILEKMFLT